MEAVEACPRLASQPASQPASQQVSLSNDFCGGTHFQQDADEDLMFIHKKLPIFVAEEGQQPLICTGSTTINAVQQPCYQC